MSDHETRRPTFSLRGTGAKYGDITCTNMNGEVVPISLKQLLLVIEEAALVARIAAPFQEEPDER